MLAMYVVLESYLSLVADYPAAYESQPGFEFIKEVPTVWDETKVLDAKPGQFITIARRKGKDWYIGTITNHAPRQFSIPLDFLGPGNYIADVYRDGPDTDINPNHLVKEIKKVSAATVISIEVNANGGEVMHLHLE